MATSEPAPVVPGIRTIEVLNEQEMNQLRARADQEIGSRDAQIIHSHVTIRLVFGRDRRLTTKIAVLIEKQTQTLYIGKTQLESFSDQRINEIICERIPALPQVIKRHAQAGVELPFLLEKKEPVFVPINRSAAAGILLAFFNGRKDPLDRIRDLLQVQADTTDGAIGRILITYYLSCIMYVMNIDFTDQICEDYGMLALTDDLSLISRNYRTAYLNIKAEKREIPQGLLAFQAVFGAYCMCRPVANKKDFRSWVTKRYSAFMSSIQQTSEANVYLDYQRGGTIVNEAIVARTPIRRLIYNIITSNVEEIVPAAVKVHVKMLTALSEMTTYSLIQQVISKGGCVITLDPLPKQLKAYSEESLEIKGKLEAAGHPNDHIIYLHLVLPHVQAFTASKYADLVVTAQVMEEVESPRETTLELYKAKISNAVINKRYLKQFIITQSQNIGLRIDESSRESLQAQFGERANEMYEEAKRILGLIRDQRPMV